MDRPLILVVEAEPAKLEFLTEVLSAAAYRVATASGFQDALEQVFALNPDCVVASEDLARGSGQALCRELHEQNGYLPTIVVMSPSAPVTDLVMVVEQGATDVVSSPLFVPLLLAKIRSSLRLGQRIKSLTAALLQAEAKANTDALTGLANRRMLFERLAEETSRAKRFGFGLVVLMVDVDHFKEINDQLGHGTGDQVLVELSAVMKFNTRAYDVLCRYGGDEFTLILPQTERSHGLIVAERIRKAVETYSFSALTAGATVSIGLASLPEDGEDPNILLQSADLALYHAKQAGRNQVHYVALY